MRRTQTAARRHAPNGQWIWKLTGRTLCYSREPGAEPVVMVEGVWPD
jgi:hypothetical protein